MENKLHVLKMNDFIFKKVRLLRPLVLVFEQEYTDLEVSLMSWDNLYSQDIHRQQLV